MPETPERPVERAGSASYSAADIQVLDDITHVRRRPAMYIGDVGERGFHHCVYEGIDNSVDEAMAGFCTRITLTIHVDGSVSVDDDGRGIPVDEHPERKRPAVEVVLTTLRSGGKFEQKAYKASGGLHGVGISVTNALSEWFEVEVRRDGGIFQQRYRRGVPTGDLRRLGATEQRGTKVTFKPDPEIFGAQEFRADKFAERLRTLAFLNPGLTIRLHDERDGRDETYHYEGGIVAFVQHMNANKALVHDEVIAFKRDTEEGGRLITVAIAFQYNAEYGDNLQSFVNNIPTHEGGTHVSGFRAALTRTINAHVKVAEIKVDAEALQGDDLREGLSAIVSVRVPEPQFEGQTKTKLGNSEVGRFVETVVNEELGIYLEEHPQVAKAIITKAVTAAQAREAARKMRDLVRRKGALSSGSLPGKLADCQSKDKDESEMFIVEGDSAGGCFSGETKVALADGRDVPFVELAREWEAGKRNWCYTIAADGRVALAPILNVRCTKRAAPVVRVTLDDGTAIVCTPDHRFMLADRRYRQAGMLESGDELRTVWSGGTPAIGVAARAGRRSLAAVAGSRGTSAHLAASPELAGSAALATLPDDLEAERDSFAEAGSSAFEAQLSDSEVLASLLRGTGRPARLPRAILRRFLRIEGPCVRSVELLPVPIDVYDLEVPETHNFALAAGVFVHNSAKQARNRRFQAILPIRGKILNVEKARLDKMLSHTELQTIISALGTGIGHDEFDLEKLRYGRLVIMCDADIDGSHIRTLLLTFFFRQMPQLIEHGHIYIAQPPLYRIARKGHERYVQTDAELTAELLRLGTTGAELELPGGKRIAGEALRALCEVLAKVDLAVRRLGRLDVPVAELLAHRDATTGALPLFRVEGDGAARWFASDVAVNTYLREAEGRGRKVTSADTPVAPGERPPADALMLRELHGVDTLGTLLTQVAAMGVPTDRVVAPADAPPVFHLLGKGGEDGGAKVPLRDLVSVLEAVRAAGQKGVDVQRFKGLGEMQPEQLWETTMDPSRRTMLRVQISDAVEADRIFTILMGEVVEPRRAFIEKFAREVRNLDV